MDTLSVITIVMVILLVAVVIESNVEIIRNRRKISKKYNVSKFPVVSKMGNKYYAEVVYNHTRFNEGTDCNFYKRTFKKSGKYKDELIDSTRVDLEGFKYDYIKVISECIEGYEYDHRKELEHKLSEKLAIRENKELFNQWDGVIK